MPTRDEILVNTRLTGAREFVGAAEAEAAALGELGAASELTGRRMAGTTRRSFIANQAMFTSRRILYGTTLAVIALGAATLKMGFDFDSSMQTAQVAMKGFLGSEQAANKELAFLYNLAAFTPLRFTDITNAARLMLGFGFTVQETNRYLTDIIDMLTALGVDSPASIRRVTIALGHMQNVGYVTGQTLYQLARDNIPVYEILQKQLGLTADQLHNIGHLHIPANVVMQAIARGIEQDPRYHGAARRLALTTFHGLFTTMQDFAAQFFGNVEKPIFVGAENTLKSMVMWFQLLGNAAQQSGGNLDYIMSVVDQKLPGALALWRALSGAVSNLWHIFTFFFSDLLHSQIVWGTVFFYLEAIRGALWFVRQNMGPLMLILKIMLPLWILWHTYLKITAFWLGITKGAELALTATTRELTFAQFLAAVAMGRYQLMAKLAAAATWLYVWAQIALTTATEYLRVQMALLTIVLLTNPLVAIIAAVVLLTAGLVILYFKWQRFHDFVNGSATVIYNNIIKPFMDAFHWIKSALDMAIRFSAWTDQHTTGDVFHLPFGLGEKAHFGLHNPFRAGGGPVYSGMPYIVGERGPEMVTFGRSGYVHNAEQTQSIFSMPQSWAQQGGRQPIVVQLVVEKRVLAELVTDVELGHAARA